MSDVRLLGPLCGVLFSILFVLTVVLVGDTGRDGADAARILREDSDRFFYAFLVGTVSTAALLGFFAWLRELLREAAPGRTFLGSLMLPAAAASAALLPGSLAVMFGAAEAAREEATSPEVGSMVMNVQYGFLVAGFMLAGLAVVCASVGLLRSGRLPSWLCWAGIVAGVLQLVAFAFLPMMLLVLWILVAGIVLMVRRGRDHAGAVSPP